MSDQLTTVIRVPELCCTVEEDRLRKSLASLPGTRVLKFDLLRHTVEVDHTASDEVVLQAVRSAGFAGSIHRGDRARRPPTPHRRMILVAGSVVLLVSGALAEFALDFSTLAIALYVSAIASGGWEIAWRALRSLRALRLDVNVLMTAAAVGAVILGDHAEGAAVLVLYSLSLLLESLSIDRTQRAISALFSLTPPTALVVTPGDRRSVPVEEVRPGQTILIRPGERVPLDGEVTEGISSVDESAVSGESLPVFKELGDRVHAGTLNGRGSLSVRVTAGSDGTLLHRIAEYVEEARARKTVVQTQTERFARWYVPGIFLSATALAIIPPILFQEPFEEWLYRALTMLVISCPCAFLLSTPMAVVSALTAGVRAGALIRSGSVLERLASVRVVAIDKTGTLTHGRHRVTTVKPLGTMNEAEIIRTTATLEARSEHPLADALLQYAVQLHVNPEDAVVTGFQAIPGRGIQGVVDGREMHVGNHALMEAIGVCSPSLEGLIFEMEGRGETVLILSDAAQPLGLIGLRDTARHDSATTVAEVRQITGNDVTLLSGDNEEVANRLAMDVGITHVIAGVLPQEKARVIEELRSRYGSVAMVGDGLNDAPALATADVGIAMGKAGAESAMTAADVVLMQDRLDLLPRVLRMARQARGIIRWNMTIALTAKAAFLVLGAAGITGLWWAVLADDGLTLLVLLNSLRLLKFGNARADEFSTTSASISR